MGEGAAITVQAIDYTALAATLSGLTGARVQQVRGPDIPGVIQLQLYRPSGFDTPDCRRLWLDVWARQGVAAIWRTEIKRPNRANQGGFVMHLRKHSAGSRLTEVRALANGLALGWQNPVGTHWLVAYDNQLTWCAPKPKIAWPGRVNPGMMELIESAPSAPQQAICSARSDLEKALSSRFSQTTVSSTALQQARRSLRTKIRRVRRLVEAIEGDLQQAGRSDELRHQGEVLKSQLHKVPSGAELIELQVPWNPTTKVTIELKRALSPAENLARLFRRARGFEQHRTHLQRRRDEARTQLQQLTELRDRLVGLDEQSAAALLHVGSESRPSQLSTAPKRRSQNLPKGVQRWLADGDLEVLLGRNGSANDTIVTRLARGKDIWMHVRDKPGAHLLLRWSHERSPPSDLIVSCAVLCAWASGGKIGHRVDVMWTRCRHVRKAKGAAPGKVYVSGEKSILVDIDKRTMEAWKRRRPS
ncbi:MAG TPA: hypothetical protein DCQ06_04375 [Myxococcales bacterium]|nr:hypothetical protein [Myxococcales bacterium]